MILIYVSDNDMGKVSDLGLMGRVGYRNPYYWRGEVEKCNGCYVIGNHPKLKKAYKDRLIEIDSKDTKEEVSSDYTIRELAKIRSEYNDQEWEEFTQYDNRKSIDNL